MCIFLWESQEPSSLLVSVLQMDQLRPGGHNNLAVWVPPHSAPVCKKSEEQGGRDKGRTRADSSPKFPPLMKGGMCAKRLGEARGSSGG